MKVCIEKDNVVPRYIVRVYSYNGLIRVWAPDYVKVRGKTLDEILNQCIEAGVVEKEDMGEFKLVFVKRVHM